MRKLLPPTPTRRINRSALRQARIGVTVGMLLGLGLNGFSELPMSVIHATLNADLSPLQIHEQMSQGEYRVAMHCPMKNNRVSYHVQAANSGGAHMALEWIMPACRLSQMVKASGSAEGKIWFVGEFVCEGSSYKKSINVAASSLRDATNRARDLAKGCHVETVDQTRCPTYSPFCDRQSEDFRHEAELSVHRMLR
jgi:hypothetical protein